MAAKNAAHGYEALKPESFDGVGPEQFEALLEELVRRELSDRHAPGWTLEGGPPPATAGFDLRCRIHHAPNRTAEAFTTEVGAPPLTFDDLDRPVVYSVKTGTTQREKAKEEARSKSDWAVQALREGGRFVLVLNVRTNQPLKAPSAPAKGTPRAKPRRGSKATASGPAAPPRAQADLRRELATLYHARLKALDPSALDPFDRVHVIDASDLCAYLRASGYTLSSPLRDALGVPRIPGMLDFEGFSRAHGRDRPAGTEFVWDASRKRVADQLLDALSLGGADAFGRVVRFVSPPGVGKTRLAVETLRTRAAERSLGSMAHRVFAAITAADARLALTEHALLASYHDAIVIVDDVAHDDVHGLVSAFGAGNSSGAAALVMITAAAPSQIPAHAGVASMTLIELDPREDEACQEILRNELGVEPDRTLLEIVKGFPWFAVIVGRELAKNPLRKAPRTRSDAVDLALCPGAPNLATELRRRGAALAIVMLLEGEPLQGLNKPVRDEVLEAFCGEFSSWADLMATIEACAGRGLLRPGAGGVFQYVTPAVVELEIAQRWLTPPPPDRPLRDRLTSSRWKVRFQKLLDRLSRLGFSPSALADLAAPIVADLESSSLPGELRSSSSEILFAARHQPASTAAALRRLVDAADLTELFADRQNRRSLMFALESLAGRRDAFDDAEAALFRLARAENESYGNNATAVWAGLFDVALNTTYRTFDERLPLLESRLRDPDSAARAAALAAVNRIIVPSSGIKVVGEAPDGPYPTPTYEEARRAVLAGFRLLVERTRDEDPDVATRAGEIVARGIRSAIRAGVITAIAESMMEVPTDLAETTLRKIREAFEMASHYDEALIRDQGAARAWSRMREHFAARSYREELRQRVGAWGPVALREDESADRALAARGLAPPAPLLDELDWLASKEAVRGVPFGIALGHVDADKQVLEGMIQCAPDAADLVSAYLLGRKDAGDEEMADAAIQRMRSDPRSRDAVATAIWRLRASPGRLAVLLDDIEHERVSERSLNLFATSSWAADLSDDDLERLVRTLREAESVAAISLAVDLLEQRVRERPEVGSRFGELLADVFEQSSRGGAAPAGHFDYVWARAAESLVRLGFARRVAASVVASIASTPAHSLPRPEVEEVLAIAVEADPGSAWDALRAALDDPAGDVVALTCKRAKIASKLPYHRVKAWMKADASRAVRVASMISMHEGPSLPELARALIDTQGARSRAAGILLDDLQSTPRAVSSIAEFAGRQIQRVERWRDDSDAEVRGFAQRSLRELARSRDSHAASEEYERRRWGT